MGTTATKLFWYRHNSRGLMSPAASVSSATATRLDGAKTAAHASIHSFSTTNPSRLP